LQTFTVKFLIRSKYVDQLKFCQVFSKKKKKKGVQFKIQEHQKMQSLFYFGGHKNNDKNLYKVYKVTLLYKFGEFNEKRICEKSFLLFYLLIVDFLVEFFFFTKNPFYTKNLFFSMKNFRIKHICMHTYKIYMPCNITLFPIKLCIFAHTKLDFYRLFLSKRLYKLV